MILIKPWRTIKDSVSQALKKELLLEVHPEHRLYGKTVTVIGKRDDQDNILITIDGTNTVAIVHLTYKRAQESGVWPETDIMSISEFKEIMRKENTKYE
jgi:hypothetical protein